MAVVVEPGVEAWEQRNNEQAQHLLTTFVRAAPRSGPPSAGLPPLGGDHPQPRGLFAEWLFAPLVWPVDSETQLADFAAEHRGRAEKAQSHFDDAVRYRKRVFDGGLWVGRGAEAAELAYMAAEQALLDFIASNVEAAELLDRASSDVERTKRLMAAQYDAMNTEIEAFLRSGSGQSLAQIAVIIGKYRPIIHALSVELHACASQYTTQHSKQLLKKPKQGPHVFTAGLHSGDSSPVDDPQSGPSAGPHSADLSPPGGRGVGKTPGDHTASHSPEGPSGPLVPGQGLPSLLGSGGGLPGLPSGGGGGLGGPLSGLHGLFSGVGFPPGVGLSGAGLGPGPVAPQLASGAGGSDFGRGLAAGVSAAGAVPAVAPPVSAVPAAPLVSPEVSAPVSAAPAAAPVTAAPHAASAAVPAAAGSPGGLVGGGLAPYGSVLPPTAPAAAAGAVSPAAAAAATAAGGPGPGAAGLVPAVAARRREAALRREETDAYLAEARRAVAELAGASCVVDAGLDWAVAVGHNMSGQTTLWVATNDGAAYVPPGVFLRVGMMTAADFDEDFDARWLGWVNPAEKAVRAARAFGDTVGAVATTWAYPSDFLSDPDDGVREVAIGVPHAGLDSPAAELVRGRVHRLETVDPRLYADMKATDESVVRAFCRELTRRVAFGGGFGSELSAAAQAVARALVAGEWPKPHEWAAVEAEYESERMMSAAQRPGLDGMEDPDQSVSYRRVFINCRRLETLVCWKRSEPAMMAADIVYAAWAAGVRAEFPR